MSIRQLLLITAAGLFLTATAVKAQEPADLEPAVSFDDPDEATESVAAIDPAAQSAEHLEPAVSGYRAMDTLVLDRTSITGNSELPKILVIVPWKKSDLGDVVGRPVNSLLDEILSPVDRMVFQRHLRYYNDLYNPEANVSDHE